MERIMKYISRVYRATWINRDEAFPELGLTGIQVGYINLICKYPGTTQDELAKWLFVNKSSVTRQVCQLKEMGFITRETCPEDKRAKRLYPTEKAKEIFPQINRHFEEWNDILTGSLSPEDQEKLLELLKHLAREATDHVDHPLAQLEERL